MGLADARMALCTCHTLPCPASMHNHTVCSRQTAEQTASHVIAKVWLHAGCHIEPVVHNGAQA